MATQAVGSGAAASPPTSATTTQNLARLAHTAAARVRPYVRETPLERLPWLSAAARGEVFLKLESMQVTGSFKVRGAVNKLLTLSADERRRGLVTCSTGNHALAFLHACAVVPMPPGGDKDGDGVAPLPPPLIYLPTTASSAKSRRLEASGAALVRHGEDCVDAEAEARRVANERGLVYVSPYNDVAVMTGQGTLAVELLHQLQEAGGVGDGDDNENGNDLVVFVPVGGGGLIGGVAAVLKAARGAAGVRVVGCQPAVSDVMRQSVAAGHIVEDASSAPTLSDATAGGIERGAVTLRPCIECVDEWVTLSEQEIADAVLNVLHHAGKLVEGAAGCAVAAAVRAAAAGELAGKRAVVVCCGGNIAVDALRRVLDEGRVC